MAVQVIYGMPQDDYRAAAGLSHSGSKDLRKSPHHFHARNSPPFVDKAPSPQMFMGTLVHCATLEPAEFDARYVVGPDVSHNSNHWKDFVRAHTERGMTPISQEQRDQAFAMAASVRALPDFAAIIQACATEVSLWWDCPATGVACKARPDVVRRYPPGISVVCETEERAQLARERGFAVLADLKSTEDASPEAFARSVADYSYHTQASWYIEGAEAALGVPVLSCLFAVVEREFPYAAASYTLDNVAMHVAGEINLAARQTYAACERAASWPGYPSATRDIALPPWYLRRYLEGKNQ